MMPALQERRICSNQQQSQALRRGGRDSGHRLPRRKTDEMAPPIDRHSQPWEPADEFVVNKQKAEEGHDDDYKDCLKPRMITSNDWAGHMIPP